MEIKLLKPNPKIYSEDKFEYLNTLFNYESYEEALQFLNDTYFLGRIANEMWYNKALISMQVNPEKNYDYLIKRVLKLKRFKNNKEILYTLFDNYENTWNKYDKTESLRTIDKIIKLYPDDLDAKFLKAQICFWLSDKDYAIEVYKNLIENQYDAKFLNYLIGMGYLDFYEPNFKEALVYFYRALGDNPDYGSQESFLKYILIALIHIQDEKEFHFWIYIAEQHLKPEEIKMLQHFYYNKTNLNEIYESLKVFELMI